MTPEEKALSAALTAFVQYHIDATIVVLRAEGDERVAAEREACAVVADELADYRKQYLDMMHCNRFVRDQARHEAEAAVTIAAAIRARGEE